MSSWTKILFTSLHFNFLLLFNGINRCAFLISPPIWFISLVLCRIECNRLAVTSFFSFFLQPIRVLHSAVIVDSLSSALPWGAATSEREGDGEGERGKVSRFRIALSPFLSSSLPCNRDRCSLHCFFFFFDAEAVELIRIRQCLSRIRHQNQSDSRFLTNSLTPTAIIGLNRPLSPSEEERERERRWWIRVFTFSNQTSTAKTAPAFAGIGVLLPVLLHF